MKILECQFKFILLLLICLQIISCNDGSGESEEALPEQANHTIDGDKYRKLFFQPLVQGIEQIEVDGEFSKESLLSITPWDIVSYFVQGGMAIEDEIGKNRVLQDVVWYAESGMYELLDDYYQANAQATAEAFYNAFREIGSSQELMQLVDTVQPGIGTAILQINKAIDYLSLVTDGNREQNDDIRSYLGALKRHLNDVEEKFEEVGLPAIEQALLGKQGQGPGDLYAIEIDIEVADTKENGQMWDVLGGSPDIFGGLIISGDRYFLEMQRDSYFYTTMVQAVLKNSDRIYIVLFDEDIRDHDLIGNGRASFYSGKRQMNVNVGQASVTIKLQQL